jgi:hypothetical protein
LKAHGRKEIKKRRVEKHNTWHLAPLRATAHSALVHKGGLEKGMEGRLKMEQSG